MPTAVVSGVVGVAFVAIGTVWAARHVVPLSVLFTSLGTVLTALTDFRSRGDHAKVVPMTEPVPSASVTPTPSHSPFSLALLEGLLFAVVGDVEAFVAGRPVQVTRTVDVTGQAVTISASIRRGV